jgi:hypothetical protein
VNTNTVDIRRLLLANVKPEECQLGEGEEHLLLEGLFEEG